MAMTLLRTGAQISKHVSERTLALFGGKHLPEGASVLLSRDKGLTEVTATL
jgi:hypothetical protein